MIMWHKLVMSWTSGVQTIVQRLMFKASIQPNSTFDSLKTTWAAYQERHQLTLLTLQLFCLHLPYPKLALKGLNKIIPKDLNPENKERLTNNFDASITYSRQIGNIYTGSLYLGLLLCLNSHKDFKAGDKIGFFSYGSGAVSEIFSGRLVEGYKDLLRSDRLDTFAKRQQLSVADYEKLFYEEAQLDDTGSLISLITKPELSV